MDFSGQTRAELIADLIVHEIDKVESLPLNIPLPSDRRLQKVFLRLKEQVDFHISLEKFLDEVGASAKTLSRLCQKELGMNYSEWRRRIQFSFALEELAKEKPIKVVAHICGYKTTSAFSYAFKKEFGTCPSTSQKAHENHSIHRR